MTQEEKAKVYDEALERAKKLQKTCDSAAVVGWCEYIFPEIRESEGEKIRKEIINFLELPHPQFVGKRDHEKWLAWLEKQGEQKPNPYSGTSFEYNGHTWGMCARDNGVDILLDKQLFKHLEKQDEQKQEINNFDVLPGLYQCVHRMFDGTPDGRLLFEVGNVYKCLSKHDRAEFEVSYGHSVYLEDPVVCKHFIPFEKQGEQKPAVEMKTPEESLGIDSDTYNKIVDKCIYGENKPADKVESKFKVGDWVVYYRNDSSREVLQVYDIRDGRYYFTDNVHFSWSVKECDEKSHLWTISDARDGDVLVYKDEIFLFNCVDNDSVLFHCCYDDDLIIDSFYAFINKELSDVHPATNEQCDTLMKAMADAGYTFDFDKRELKKIEQKSVEWSEDDEEMLRSIIATCELAEADRDSSPARHLLEMQLNWLKSLRPQNHWKPSDEQMEIIDMLLTNETMDDNVARVLRELKEQLKELKGE